MRLADPGLYTGYNLQQLSHEIRTCIAADCIFIFIFFLIPEPVPNSTQTEGREIPAPCSGSFSLTLIYLCAKCNYSNEEEKAWTHVWATQVVREVAADE